MSAIKSRKVNPLMHPVSERPVCELCERIATLSCPYCKITYYCTKEHQTLDWNGIHMKICTHVQTLHDLSDSQTLYSTEERKRRKKVAAETLKELIELSAREALKLLHEGQYALALPAALQSLKCTAKSSKKSEPSLELVSAYLLLGEASIGLGKYSQAETYLSNAKWIVLKTPNCPSSIRSRLCRIFGKLYASVGNHNQALQQLAKDIYYSSLQNGPRHFSTCGGYFQMASVFLDSKATDSALAMFAKVVEICTETLEDSLEQWDNTGTFPLDEASQVECFQMLTRVLKVEDVLLGDVHTSVADCHFALGLHALIRQDNVKAKENIDIALKLYTDALGQHPMVTKIKKYAKRLASFGRMEKRESDKD